MEIRIGHSLSTLLSQHTKKILYAMHSPIRFYSDHFAYLSSLQGMFFGHSYICGLRDALSLYLHMEKILWAMTVIYDSIRLSVFLRVLSPRAILCHSATLLDLSYELRGLCVLCVVPFCRLFVVLFKFSVGCRFSSDQF